MGKPLLFLLSLGFSVSAFAEFRIVEIKSSAQVKPLSKIEITLFPGFIEDDAILAGSQRVAEGNYVTLDRPYLNHRAMAERFLMGARQALYQHNMIAEDASDSEVKEKMAEFDIFNWFLEEEDFVQFYRAYSASAKNYSQDQGRLKAYRMLSWRNHGFTIIDHKANPEDAKYDRNAQQNLEGLRQWIIDVHGRDYLEELILSLKGYKVIDVRNFSFEPESVVAAYKNGLLGQEIKTCVSVFWQARSSGHHEFCGTMMISLEGDQLVKKINFDRWYDDHIAAGKDDAQVVFPAAVAALSTTYKESQHLLALMVDLAAAAQQIMEK